MSLDLAFMQQIFPDMLRAFWLSVQISLITVVLSVILGIFLTAARMLGGTLTKYVIISFVEFTKRCTSSRTYINNLFFTS